jgi:hypothetical protein
MKEERRLGKRFLLHSWVQITGIDESGSQFSERTRLEDVGDSGCRFTLQRVVRGGGFLGIIPLGQEGQTLRNEFSRLFVIIWVKHKGDRLTVGARSLREDELSDGGLQAGSSTAKISAK